MEKIDELMKKNCCFLAISNDFINFVVNKNLINTFFNMTLKKYILALFSILFISVPLLAQPDSNELMTKKAKSYVALQKNKIGKMDNVLNLKLTKMYATDRVVKVVYTKGSTNFTSIFPEMTDGKFKTEAQENRYVAREYCIWKVASDAITSSSLSSIIKGDVYTWLVDVMGPEGEEPLYSFDFKTLAVRNAIDLCGGKIPVDFKAYLSKTLVERALHSLLKEVYLPHDSAGFCNTDLKNQILSVDLLTTHRGYPIMKEHNGEVARMAWLGAFMNMSKSKRYFKDLCDIIKVRQLSVEIKVRDVANFADSSMFKIYPTEILDFVAKPTIADVESFIIGKLGGKKQSAEDRGKFTAYYSSKKAANASSAAASKSKRVYEVVEEMPSFPGGQQAITAYLERVIRYPEVCVDERIQGRVICQFTVTKDGHVRDVIVTRSIHPLLDKEAVRVVSLMPKWYPAMHNGERVDSKYTIPVTFRLTK